jgi:hypothetical protein
VLPPPTPARPRALATPCPGSCASRLAARTR